MKNIPFESVESLRARSPFTAEEMLSFLEKSKKEELELEDPSNLYIFKNITK